MAGAISFGALWPLTAKDICRKADLHKTKVSRAVAALEAKRFLSRTEQAEDRRYGTPTLSSKGYEVYQDLCFMPQIFTIALLIVLMMLMKKSSSGHCKISLTNISSDMVLNLYKIFYLILLRK